MRLHLENLVNRWIKGESECWLNFVNKLPYLWSPRRADQAAWRLHLKDPPTALWQGPLFQVFPPQTWIYLILHILALESNSILFMLSVCSMAGVWMYIFVNILLFFMYYLLLTIHCKHCLYLYILCIFNSIYISALALLLTFLLYCLFFALLLLLLFIVLLNCLLAALTHKLHRLQD